MSAPITREGRRDALVGRLFGAAVQMWDVLALYVGDRLGLYRALAERGPSSSAELARATGLNERYLREWLEQQAASGILELDRSDRAALRYVLPAGHDEALVDDASLNCIAPLGQLMVASARPLDAVLDAFRSGEGVPYADYGRDLHEGQARFTRPMFDRLLTTEWLPAAPEVHERLLADPPARVADVACGEGRSTLALARGYPKVRVDGIDSDPASITAARKHLAEDAEDVGGRVEFHLRDAADEALAGTYDLVYIHEALHDMSYPVDVLAACRAMLADGGKVVVADENVPDAFAPPGADIERFYYGFSVFHCLPVGMVGEGAAGTGTVMRAGTVRRYAEAAGFRRCEVLPVENDFYRFYLLEP